MDEQNEIIRNKLRNKTNMELYHYITRLKISKFHIIQVEKLNSLLEKVYSLGNNEEGNHEWM